MSEARRTFPGRLHGRVAIVTGSATGIGAASARRLAAEGAAVLLADVNVDGAEAVVQEILSAGGRALAHLVDVSVDEQVRAAVELAVSKWGGLDVLHNNAVDSSLERRQQDLPVADIDPAFFMRTLEINLLGALLCTKYALPAMLARGGGAIVNTSSGAGSSALLGGMTAYGASKGGLESLTRSTAAQYGRRGIRCNAIAPGLTRSAEAIAAIRPEVAEVFTQPLLSAIAQPEDQAAVVAFLASDEARHINGQVIHTSGGINIVSTTNAIFAYAAAVGTVPEPPPFIGSSPP